MKRFRCFEVPRLLLLAAAVLALACPGFAQFTSVMEGSVMDASKAAIPGAKVRVTNQATSVTYSSESNHVGVFRVAALPLGIYTVSIEADGFKTWQQKDITLEANQVRTLNIALDLSTQQSSIEVVATLAVETGKSSTGTEIAGTTIELAPLLSRNIYTGLVAMVPGLTGTGMSDLDNYSAEANYGINSGGQPDTTNEYQVDGAGVGNSSRGGQTYFNPQPDIVEAVKVNAADFSADKGRFSGASIQVFTKSGTNGYHGSLSEYHTNNLLTARTISQLTLPATRRNEFGGTLGGPVIKNRTFFFVSFFGLSSSSVQSTTNTIETPQFRQFIIDQYPNSIAATMFKVAKPLVEASTNFQTIADLSKAVKGSYPVPASWPKDLPAVGTNYVDLVIPRTGRTFNGRIDHNFAKDRLSYMLMRQRGQNFSNSFRAEFNDTRKPDVNWMNKVNWIHTFSGSVQNEATFSWIRTSGGAAASRHYELPQASIGSLSFLPNNGSSLWIHNDFSWHEALNWTRNRHSLRFGIDVDRQRDDDDFSNQQLHPQFTFTNLLDFAQDLPYSQTGPIIDATTGGPAVGLLQRIRMLYAAPFVQDDIKVARNFTLNLGLRYDYFGHMGAVKNDRIAIPQFQFGPGSTIAEQVANGYMKTLGDPGYIIPNRIGGWGPRIGFGWDVFGKGTFAVRGGWGVYYNKLGSLAWIARLNPPNWAQPSINMRDPGAQFSYHLGPNYDPPASVLIQTDPKGGIVGTRVGVTGTDANFQAPRTQTYMLSLQKTISTWLVEADFNGSHSDRQLISGNVNRFAGDLIVNNGVMQRLNQSFGNITMIRTIGIANSNLVTLMASRRFTRSWSMKAMFSVGRSINWVDMNNQGNSTNLADWMNPAASKGRADFDVKKRLALESVVLVPSLFRHGIGYGFFGGWRLTNIAIFQDGHPFSVYSAQAYPNGDFNADGNNYDYPNAPAFGGNIIYSRRDFQDGLFKKADFPVPPRGMPGDLGRNVFTGPGFANVNTSIAKTFKLNAIGERGRLDVVGELYNTLNRVNLNDPNGSLNNANFGRSLTSTRPRRAQFGLRVNF